jgi:EamA domain-containing membrane protein RarD
MHHLFDLRFVIGLFFLVVGILLFLYGAFFVKETINIACGVIFILFGSSMLIMSRKCVRDHD